MLKGRKNGMFVEKILTIQGERVDYGKKKHLITATISAHRAPLHLLWVERVRKGTKKLAKNHNEEPIKRMTSTKKDNHAIVFF